MELQTVGKAEFETILSNSLYEDKSINILKQLIFKKLEIKDIAKANHVSNSYVRVVISRFKEKVKKHRLNLFMLNEHPKQLYKMLNTYHQEITTLVENGYTNEQIYKMISTTDGKFTLDDVEKYVQQLQKGF